jgi:E3 ubiquitin-protein ligase synoviolin
LENLYERSWYALTETFLAMTIFRDDFNLEFASYFIVLTFMKVFHWICSDRVDLIFQTAQPPTMVSKVRLWLALAMFLALDIMFVRSCAAQLFINGPGVMVMFAFEFALLVNSAALSIGKYVLNQLEERYLMEHEDEDRWERKSVCMFGLEVLSDVSRLLIYISFFVFMLKPYGPPIHVMRDVYMTAASFIGRIRDFVKFRRARMQMDELIADAQAEDLVQETVCIVCREDMEIQPDQPQRYIPKKLACGHVIHYGCLKSWLERSQRCPTCRGPVIGGESEQAGWRAPTAPANHNHNNNDNNNNANTTATGNTNNEANREGPGPGVGPSEPLPQVLSGRNRLIPEDSVVVNSPGFKLPTGWTALRARQDEEGVYQIQLNNDTWATVESTTGPIGEDQPEVGTSAGHTQERPSRKDKTRKQPDADLQDTVSRLEARVARLETVQERMEQVVDRLEQLCTRVETNDNERDDE